MEKLTHQEEEIMLVIWKKKRGIIKDFLEQLPEPQPPYTTVASIVKNLEKKGFLSSEKIGNTYLYIPRITQTEYKKKFLSGIVKSYRRTNRRTGNHTICRKQQWRNIRSHNSQRHKQKSRPSRHRCY